MQNDKHAYYISVITSFPLSPSTSLSVSVLSLLVSLGSSASFTVDLITTIIRLNARSYLRLNLYDGLFYEWSRLVYMKNVTIYY
jgi:hypothetical protein